jgi:PIN domain nuclease of toxin-antitoxin system
LILTDPLDVYVARWAKVYQIKDLPIRTPHALRLAGLPDHHRDPFDRMLIARRRRKG